MLGLVTALGAAIVCNRAKVVNYIYIFLNLECIAYYWSGLHKTDLGLDIY